MDAMDKLDRLKRKIRVLSRLVFGRTAMVLVAVLLQVAMIVVGSNLLYKYFAIYYMAFQIIGLIVVVHIFNEDTKDFNKPLSTLRPHMVDMLLLVE